ncbi:MAG: YlxR family protein [Bacillota bacterium]|nr:YlxR family protein [Bacillota bacterium]
MKKKKPVRTCVGCEVEGDKRALVRIVRTPEGTVELDPTGRKNGRGAYVCSYDCLETVLRRGRLERALRAPLSPEDKERLREAWQTLFPEAQAGSSR